MPSSATADDWLIVQLVSAAQPVVLVSKLAWSAVSMFMFAVAASRTR